VSCLDGTVLFDTVPYGTGPLWLSCPILSIGPTTITARAVLSLCSQSSPPPPSLSPSPTLMAPVTLLARLKSLYSKDQGMCCCDYPPTSLTVQISPCCPSTQPPCSRYVLFVWNVDPSSPSRLVHISAVLSPTPSLPC
jgi:hypothetical protein